MAKVRVVAKHVGKLHWRGKVEGVSDRELKETGVDLNGSARTVRERSKLAVEALFGEGTDYEFILTVPRSMHKLRDRLEVRRARMEKAREEYNRAVNELQATRFEFCMAAVDKMDLKPPDIASIVKVSAQTVRKLIDPGSSLHQRAMGLSKGKIPMDTPHITETITDVSGSHARTKAG